VNSFEFGTRDQQAQAARRILNGKFDLVLWAGGDVAPHEFLQADVAKLPHTKFVFIDSTVQQSDVAGHPNAAALHFRDDEAGHLAGYLGGLMAARGATAGHRPVVSAVGGRPDSRPVRELISGYITGVHSAVPGAKVLVDYSNDFGNESICEQIATQQIN